MDKLNAEEAAELLAKAESSVGNRDYSDRFLMDTGRLSELFVEVFKLKYPELKPEVKEGRAAISLDVGEQVAVLGLTSLYDRLVPLDVGLRRDLILERIVHMAGIVEKFLNPEQELFGPIDRNEIVPIVMSKVQYSHYARQFGPDLNGGEKPIVCWPLAEGVLGVLSVNGADTLKHVIDGQLDPLGINVNEARVLALRNLKRLYAAEKYRFDYRERLFEVRGMDGLASSLIMIPEFWEKQKRALGDDIVIHLISRDTLMFMRRSDTDMVNTIPVMVAVGKIGILVDGMMFEYRKDKVGVYYPDGMPRPH